MKDFKVLLISFIEVITFLLTSFGGFLRNISPPDQVGASYPTGILSFLLLIVLMGISAVARNRRRVSTTHWMTAGGVLFLVALGSSFFYPYVLSAYTYPHAEQVSQRSVNASDKYLTPDGRQYKLANPGASAEDLVHNLPDGDIWTREGIEQAGLLLTASYVALVLAISGAIFCLLEANLSGRPEQKVSAASVANRAP
jgi:hypothetical protein